ncbi:hypothetical protein GT755_12440 [Herbidospora sp. NEAU-GS84]|uniref:Uncharacterized protein n=1 Tax=Herbidospora solisilvae TaxID=2696284 RepID=A0A7C9MWQ5_9ACTN|nr:hypothetical protein [Herbidospora solisilvae]NAS22491.1 hypothetical protein [Herbidospora solisilvae]
MQKRRLIPSIARAFVYGLLAAVVIFGLPYLTNDDGTPLIPAPTWLMVLIGALIFAVGLILELTAETSHRLADPAQILRERITNVNRAFDDAVNLMADLQAELTRQQVAHQAVIAAAEKQKRLLEVDLEQAEKINQLLRGDAIRARRREIALFAAGMLCSIPIGFAVNWLS